MRARWRDGLLFDLRAVFDSRPKIRSARLKLAVESTWLGKVIPEINIDRSITGNGTQGHTSCVAKIGMGIERWWQRGGWFASWGVIDLGGAEGPDVSYDVTALVQKWANGAPNFGLVLQGAEENTRAFTEKACVTRYRPEDTRLVIEYE